VPSLRLTDRLALVLTLAGVRIGRRWPMILYVGILAGFFAGLFCGVARFFPATFGQTIINNREEAFYLGAGEGLFQGMAGGLMWGGATAVFLALGWILFPRPGPEWSRIRLLTNVLFGIMGGIAGGIGVFSEVWFMFTPESKRDLGWIGKMDDHTVAACIKTTYCLFYPALGPGFGAGMGLALALLYVSSRWQRFLAPHLAAGEIVDLRQTATQAVKLSALYSIPTGLLLFSSAIPFAIVLPNYTLLPVLGETFAIWIGNIGAVFGIIFGLLIMRVGVEIPPYAD
jgi:hypothetical protein